MDRLPSSPSSSCLLHPAFLLAMIITSCSIIPCSLASSDGYGDQQQLMMMDRFHGWMAAHGRSYPTAEEKLRRFHIYRDNMEFVEATNRDTSLPYSCGENQFSDLSHEEFLAMYTMPSHPVPVPLNLSSSVMITTRAGDVTENARCPPRPDLPESVDWRERGAVTPVKNQLCGCNSCWIFAAVATIESAHKIKTKNGELISLSEQEIADCSVRHCSGGLPRDVFKWVRSHGIVSESQYYRRYDAKNHSCNEAKLPRPAAVTIRGYGFVDALCEPRLAVKVTQQPVAVRFDSTDRGFQCYKKGIYVWPRPPGKNDRRYDLNHAMAVVGYGKDDEATGLNYWIAKNSWGESWGEGGYVRLRKDVPGEPEGVAGIVLKPPSYPKV